LDVLDKDTGHEGGALVVVRAQLDRAVEERDFRRAHKKVDEVVALDVVPAVAHHGAPVLEHGRALRSLGELLLLHEPVEEVAVQTLPVGRLVRAASVHDDDLHHILEVWRIDLTLGEECE
jgi:hypothetical protein